MTSQHLWSNIVSFAKNQLPYKFTQEHKAILWADERIRELESEVLKLSNIANEALGMFKCTQKTEDYSPNHWSNRLIAINEKKECGK